MFTFKNAVGRGNRPKKGMTFCEKSQPLVGKNCEISQNFGPQAQKCLKIGTFFGKNQFFEKHYDFKA